MKQQCHFCEKNSKLSLFVLNRDFFDALRNSDTLPNRETATTESISVGTSFRAPPLPPQVATSTALQTFSPDRAVKPHRRFRHIRRTVSAFLLQISFSPPPLHFLPIHIFKLFLYLCGSFAFRTPISNNQLTNKTLTQCTPIFKNTFRKN